MKKILKKKKTVPITSSLTDQQIRDNRRMLRTAISSAAELAADLVLVSDAVSAQTRYVLDPTTKQMFAIRVSRVGPEIQKLAKEWLAQQSTK